MTLSDLLIKVCPEFVTLVYFAKNLNDKRGIDDLPENVLEALKSITLKLAQEDLGSNEIQLPGTTVLERIKRTREAIEDEKRESLKALETVKSIRAQIKKEKENVIQDYKEVISEFHKIVGDEGAEEKFNSILDSVLEEVVRDESSVPQPQEQNTINDQKIDAMNSIIEEGTGNAQFSALFERADVSVPGLSIPNRGPTSGSTISNEYQNMVNDFF